MRATKITVNRVRFRTVVLVVLSGALVIALSMVILPRVFSGESKDICSIRTDSEYVAIVDEALEGYRTASDDPANDTVMNIGNVAEYSFTPLFQMRACSIGVGDTQRIHEGMQHAVYDPQFHSDAWYAAPIDVEVAWFEALGAEGLLTGWGELARGAGDARAVDSIQRLLSSGLARATHPDRQLVLDAGIYPEFLIDDEVYLDAVYTDEFVELGGSEVDLAGYSDLRWVSGSQGQYLLSDTEDWSLEERGPTVHGWSVLAPLLRFGHFHEDFLVPVATAIVEFDRARGGDWTVDGEGPVSFDLFSEDPSNAMDAVFEALSRNSAAAEVVYVATGDERIIPFTDGD